MSKETYNIIKKSKDKGLETFYVRYGKKLFVYASRNLNLNEDTAWDLIYKTIEKIIEKIDSYTFENEQKFGSFVLLSFLNNFRNFYRDAKKEIQYVSQEEIADLDFRAEEVENEENDSLKMKILKEELAKLQDWERMLLLLKAQQMPYSEIAKYVDKPEDQLKVYYSRLKKKLMETIVLKKEVQNA